MKRKKTKQGRAKPFKTLAEFAQHLPKPAPEPDPLEAAEDALLAGGVVPTERAINAIAAATLPDELSRRQFEITRLIAMFGLFDKEIAERLNISVETVGSHLRMIFSRLNVRTRVDLVRWFFTRTRQRERVGGREKVSGVK